MLKLNLPDYSYQETLDACKRGITGNNVLLAKVVNEEALLNSTANGYMESACAGELYTIPPVSKIENDPEVVGTLKKSDLLKLYDTYIVNSKKPARNIYNALLAAANEKCPFCGGIGRPRNLDHYLPKAHFPQFSILPVNLVPACRDCNMDGKGEGFAANEGEQVLQPYLDSERYFREQWIYAKYNAGTVNEPGVIEYFVQPPENWDDEQKNRVTKHFKDFNLGLRYSKEAGPRLVIYLAQIQNLTQVPLTLEAAKNVVLEPAIDASLFVNHWERIMCLALMKDLV